jgi:mRNA-degrading endonuclease toxin of MazEF toxin-antitoxin module
MCINPSFKSDLNKFVAGSVWWYRNPDGKTKRDYQGKNDDFTVDRPVFIIGGRDTPGNNTTVRVAVISKSKRRVGISIVTVPDLASKILPYNIITVKKANLVEYWGCVSRELLNEVKQAVAYHQELTNDIPKYLEGVTEEIVLKLLRGEDQTLTPDNGSTEPETAPSDDSSDTSTSSNNNGKGHSNEHATSDHFKPTLTRRAKLFYDSLTPADKIIISKSTIQDIRVIGGGLGFMAARSIKEIVNDEIKQLDLRVNTGNTDTQEKKSRVTKMVKMYEKLSDNTKDELRPLSIYTISNKLKISPNGAKHIKELLESETNKK